MKGTPISTRRTTTASLRTSGDERPHGLFDSPLERTAVALVHLAALRFDHRHDRRHDRHDEELDLRRPIHDLFRHTRARITTPVASLGVAMLLVLPVICAGQQARAGTPPGD